MKRLYAYACLALSMSLVGSYMALCKPIVAAMPAFLLGWLRFGIGGVAMVSWLKRPADEAPMTRRTKQLLFLESLLGNFLFTLFMLFGLSMTSVVAASVIMAAIPAVVALLSWLFLRERIAVQVWVAIACAASGILLLAIGGHAGEAGAHVGRSSLLGDLLVFCAVVCEASYAVMGKALTRVLGPKRITSLINAWGFLLMTPGGLYYLWGFNFLRVTPLLWGGLLFYAMAASVWTVWLWMTGLRGVPASQAGVFTVMLPVSGALVGVFVLGEPMSAGRLLAFALALAGVVLATLPAPSRLLAATPD